MTDEWEYRIIELHYGSPSFLYNQEQDTFIKRLNAEGENGWEIIEIIHFEHNYRLLIFMKRSKQINPSGRNENV